MIRKGHNTSLTVCQSSKSTRASILSVAGFRAGADAFFAGAGAAHPEEAAAKTTIKLVFPLVLFVFPAMFVVVLGPSALAIFRTFSKL